MNKNIGNSDWFLKVRTTISYFLHRYKEVYNPLNSIKYSVKCFILTETESGYVTNFEIYSEKFNHNWRNSKTN